MKPKNNPPEDRVRDHVFDGIEEFDKRLPNWWLFTLYGSIAFSFCYWMIMQWKATSDPAMERLDRELNRIALVKASAPGANLTDDQLWTMSTDTAVVAAGKETYTANCVACHKADLTGQIGPNLVDAEWIHGGKPTEVANTIRDGVAAKGMPNWGPVLGNKRVAEVSAYIMSFHQPPAADQ